MKALRRRWEKNWPELSAAMRGGLPSFVRSRRPVELGDAVPVFWYHGVEAAEFEADLAFLRENGYRTLDADALMDHLRQRKRAERAVVLSFDDGAANLFRVVLPLLQSYSARAVAFIAPRFHRDDSPPGSDSRRPCTWPEIRAMHASGLVDFQSHTMEHRYVPRWPEPVALAGVDPSFLLYAAGRPTLAEDFRTARETLETVLGKRVQHLAFPRFEGTAEAVDVGRRQGYRGFWWGLRPHRPLNRPGDGGTEIVRLSGEFLRRLPGTGRAPLGRILWHRYAGAAARWVGPTNR